MAVFQNLSGSLINIPIPRSHTRPAGSESGLWEPWLGIASHFTLQKGHCYCISFLLLPKQTVTNLAALSNMFIISQFIGQNQAWVSQCYNQGVSRAEFLSGVSREESVSCPFGLLAVPIPCSCKTELLVVLLAVSWGAFLASRDCYIPWPLGPFLHLQSQKWWIESFSHHLSPTQPGNVLWFWELLWLDWAHLNDSG